MTELDEVAVEMLPYYLYRLRFQGAQRTSFPAALAYVKTQMPEDETQTILDGVDESLHKQACRAQED